MQEVNYHCSIVEIGNIGILIEGESGAGKTSLAMGLIETFNSLGVQSILVSDDQALLNVIEGTLIAKAPTSIAGKIEIRGFGIASVPYSDSAKISLLVKLIEDIKIERMPKVETKTLLGVSLPVLNLPIRHEAQAIRIVKAWFEQNKLKSISCA